MNIVNQRKCNRRVINETELNLDPCRFGRDFCVAYDGHQPIGQSANGRFLQLATGFDPVGFGHLLRRQQRGFWRRSERYPPISTAPAGPGIQIN